MFEPLTWLEANRLADKMHRAFNAASMANKLLLTYSGLSNAQEAYEQISYEIFAISGELSDYILALPNPKAFGN